MFKKIFAVSLFFILVSFGKKHKEPLSTIAFGSCDHQYNPNKLWEEINAENPQLFIWGGDIIYGDTYNMDTLKYKYDLQKSHPGYQKLLANSMITGTYDDHDYGVNDGGKNYPHKKESRER
jgi:alkaline phosphatase D